MSAAFAVGEVSGAHRRRLPVPGLGKSTLKIAPCRPIIERRRSTRRQKVRPAFAGRDRSAGRPPGWPSFPPLIGRVRRNYPSIFPAADPFARISRLLGTAGAHFAFLGLRRPANRILRKFIALRD